MPKNKRRNRKPSAKHKRVAAYNTPCGPAAPDANIPDVKGAKTYGSAKSAHASFSPAMSRRSARGR